MVTSWHVKNISSISGRSGAAGFLKTFYFMVLLAVPLSEVAQKIQWQFLECKCAKDHILCFTHLTPLKLAESNRNIFNCSKTFSAPNVIAIQNTEVGATLTENNRICLQKGLVIVEFTNNRKENTLCSLFTKKQISHTEMNLLVLNVLQ